jgi:PAS domain S-box-containing protein
MRKKVLVVDNNKMIVRLLTVFLQQQGYVVAAAEDGLSALDQLEVFRPDVMLVDLIMPQINGEKLCRIIRKMPEYDPIFIIIISAIVAEEKMDFLSFGANACIAKGPAKQMNEHLATVLHYYENDNVDLLGKKIFGEENIFERDITKELLATKKHLEITLNHMDEGLVELTADAHVIFANPISFKLLGLSEEKVLSGFFPDFFAEPDRQRIARLLEKQDENIVELGEDKPITLHGNYLLLKFVPFYDQGRRYIIAMMHNITRRKVAEMELIHNKENLEEMVQDRTVTLEELNVELEDALCKVKTLSGLLPICAACKKIRDDQGYWNQIELFIRDHSFAEFSHGICPECARKLYPELDLFEDK